MSESNPIRVGVWGLGRAGLRTHCWEISHFPEKLKVVAACDIEADRLDKIKEQIPDCHTYLVGDEFLADPDVELVSIAVRSPQHVDYALRALAAGKMVFLEKPIALGTAGTAKLAEAMKQHPGKLYFRHNRRFEVLFNAGLDAMKSGKLGKVFEVKMCRNSYQFREDWQAIVDCGGGQLNNWGPHVIDQALQFLESPVKDVWSDLQLVTGRGDAEDHVKVLLRGENGRVVDLEISGGVAIPPPVLTIYGDRGTFQSCPEGAKLKYLKPDFAMPTYPAHRETPPLGASFSGLATPEFDEELIPLKDDDHPNEYDIYSYLYAQIREGKPFRIKPEEAFEVVRVTEIVKKQNPKFPIWNDEFGK